MSGTENVTTPDPETRLLNRIETFLEVVSQDPERIAVGRDLVDGILERLRIIVSEAGRGIKRDVASPETAESPETRIREMSDWISTLVQITEAMPRETAVEMTQHAIAVLEGFLTQIPPARLERSWGLALLAALLVEMEVHTAQGMDLLEKAANYSKEAKEGLTDKGHLALLHCYDAYRLLRTAAIQGQSSLIHESIQLSRQAKDDIPVEYKARPMELEIAALQQLASLGEDRETNLAHAATLQLALDGLPGYDDEESPDHILRWVTTKYLLGSAFPELEEDRPRALREQLWLLEKARSKLSRSSNAYLGLLHTQAMLFDSLASATDEDSEDCLRNALSRFKEGVAQAAPQSVWQIQMLLGQAQVELKLAFHAEDPLPRLEQSFQICLQVRPILSSQGDWARLLMIQATVRIHQAIARGDLALIKEGVTLFGDAVRRSVEGRNDFLTLTLSAAYAGLLSFSGELYQAHAAYLVALETLERMRALISHEDRRQALIKQYSSLYTDMVRLCLNIARWEAAGEAAGEAVVEDENNASDSQTLSGVWCEEAWRWAESSKSRSLRDRLQSPLIQVNTPEEQAALEQWQNARANLITLYQTQFAPGIPQAAASIEAEGKGLALADAMEQEQRALDRLTRLLPRVGMMVASRVPSPLILIQHLRDLVCISPAETADPRKPLLVEYFLLPPDENDLQSKGPHLEYVVFLLPLWQADQGDRIALEAVVCRLRLNELMSGLINYLLASILSRFGEETPYWQEYLESGELWKALPAALSIPPEFLPPDLLRKVIDPNIYVNAATLMKETFAGMPSFLGKTFVAPWRAALDRYTPTELIIVGNQFLHIFPLHIAEIAPEKWLVEAFPIVHLPSATLAIELLAMRRDDHASRAGRPTALVMGPPPGELEGARREAKMVARKLDETGKYQVVLAQDAEMRIETLLRIAQERELRWLHLATHSRIEIEDLMESSIDFAGESLTLERLLTDPEWRLPPIAFWYQGSCESGFSRPDSADELTGFIRALICAGARSIMASLWPVGDREGGYFARSFYDNLLEKGRNKAEAHQAAVIEVKAVWKNPYHCAPYVLFGDVWGS